jgi:hypothetical protein
MRFQAAAGKIAIYDGADDAPFTAPRSNLARVKLHTDLDYVSFVPARTINASVQALASVASRERTIILGAHGQAGVPMLHGTVAIGGLLVPLLGGVPVYGATSVAGNCIVWHLIADATNVMLHELRSYPTLGPGATFQVTVYVSDRIVS